MTNQEIKTWVDKSVKHYNENQAECLEMILYETNEAIKKYLSNPSSKTSRTMLENTMKCNRKFMREIISL